MARLLEVPQPGTPLRAAAHFAREPLCPNRIGLQLRSPLTAAAAQFEQSFRAGHQLCRLGAVIPVSLVHRLDERVQSEGCRLYRLELGVIAADALPAEAPQTDALAGPEH
jgi:hypothetical protein